MKVFLTFDVEVWCDGWSALDDEFPVAFNRYVYGHSRRGSYAIPETLEILGRHGLRGVFFVEPLFAGRFGVERLAEIVELIQEAGQEVQMHMHPEWTDEIRPVLFPGRREKRQHLHYYARDEQEVLILRGRDMLREAGAGRINAFRAGSFAVDRNALDALDALGFAYDSSLNETMSVSGNDLRGSADFRSPSRHGNVQLLPLSFFRDGMGRLRHAQVGAVSAREMKEALLSDFRAGQGAFTVLSHNFEMLKQDSSEPDLIVVRRFESICRFLAEHVREMPTSGFLDDPQLVQAQPDPNVSRVSRLATCIRLAEQALRRLN